MKVIIKNEAAVLFVLKDALEKRFNNMKEIFVQSQFPDLTILFEDGSARSYEIEYRLSSFFKHHHHEDVRLCHGIICWIDDSETIGEIEAERVHSILENYEVICLGDNEKQPNPDWVPSYYKAPDEDAESYSVSDLCFLFHICKATVYNYLSLQKPSKALFRSDDWYRLPSGHIRFKREALQRIIYKK